MKPIQFYRRSLEDPVFRREKLGELRYFRKVELGLLVLAGVGFVAHTLYFGLSEQTWDSGGIWLALLAVSAGTYAICVTRLAALEAFEEKAGRHAEASEQHPAEVGVPR